MKTSPPSSASDVASALNQIIESSTAPWPAFDVGSQPSVFTTIQARLAADSSGRQLWDALDVIDLARIQGICSDYFGSHPDLSSEEIAAWNAVVGVIEHVFALRNELKDFFSRTEQLLTAMQMWLTDTIAAVNGWVTLGESVYFQIGDDNARTIWSIILAPVQAIPKVGSTVNTILNGVVILCTSGPGLKPNPALQKIIGTTAQMNANAAAAVAAVVTQIGALRSAAIGDYGKLAAMHELLVKETSSSQWGRDQFSQSALDAAEIDIWKPMLAAGWKIEIPTSLGTVPNTRVKEDDFPAFQALMSNLEPKSIFYDQLSGLEKEDFWSGYTARCRIIGNDGGDYFSEAGATRLFDTLAVPREDVFNSQNGWALPISDGVNNFQNFPYYYRVM